MRRKKGSGGEEKGGKGLHTHTWEDSEVDLVATNDRHTCTQGAVGVEKGRGRRGEEREGQWGWGWGGKGGLHTYLGRQRS
jgi:hypothetical protein